MGKKFWLRLQLVCDYISALASWTVFYYYRKKFIEGQSGVSCKDLCSDEKFLLALLVVPFFWMLLYALWGNYLHIYRRSRLKEFLQFIAICLTGSIILFFALLLDDYITTYKAYYKLLVALFSIHFLLSYPIRLFISNNIVRRVHNRIIGFNTLMIGSNQNAIQIFRQLEEQKKSSGNHFIGFLHIENKNGKGHLLKEHLHHLGELSDLRHVIEKYEVEEVLIAIESWEHEYLKKIIEELETTQVIVKIIPDVYDILAGSVKMTSIFGEPLIEISNHYLLPWQTVLKRTMDIAVSLFCLLVLSPLYLMVSLLVKASSRGPVFYSHQRIGLNGKPFTMYKFRSMYTDAEKNGPALSSKDDPRVTPFGRFMRKVRLDELPQFFNVLIGDMSLVGPRPERQFFIDRIVQQAPHYRLLHKIKPGITSWGQVKFGYAENVDEMIQRMKYDLLYLENMSILVDLKILIYTVLIVVQGRGK
jgi:exopolysaccharide biosynthesis polyprenyl glycosylphosphotransferase